MKKCPQCGREYDNTMMFCLDDGAELLYGPAAPLLHEEGWPKAKVVGVDEPQTAILVGDGRHENATVLFDDLAIVHSVPENSIAVLPFANMSADAENEYFCDGLAEELLNALSKIENLRVAARTSAFSFKGKSANVSEIAGALKVNTVLEGSVRKSGTRIRITAQLIKAADGYHLWSERYDREMKDIFDVQDEITLAVVEALKVKLLGKKKAALLKRPTTSSEAYEFYLRGLSHFNKWTPADFEKAIENFSRAVEIDSGYAPAYAGIADAYTELTFFSFSTEDVRPKAIEAANKALQLDDTLGEAHNSLALIKMYFDWDYAAAETEFKRALSLNPGSASAHMWYGWYLALMRRFEDSLGVQQRARELDPLSPPNNNAIGVNYHWSRQPERAIVQFLDVLELNPNYPIAQSFLAEAHVQTGDLDAALDIVVKMQPEAMDPQALSVAAFIYATAGDRERAFETTREFAKRSDGEHVPAIISAYVYSGLRENDQAFAFLEKACDERSPWLPFLNVDVKLDPLCSDPRFPALLRRVGFAE